MSEMKEAVRPMGVAIDYDDTFTTCVDTWTEVIDVLRGAGERDSDRSDAKIFGNSGNIGNPDITQLPLT